MKANAKTIKLSKYVGLEAINFVLRPLQTSLISLLVIRLFNVDLWGEFVIFLVSIELFTTVLNWGQKPFLLREFALKPNEISKYWSRAVYARIPLLLLSLLLLFIIPMFRVYFLPLLLWVGFRWLGSFFEAFIQFHRKYLWSISAEVSALLVALFCIWFFDENMTLELLIYVFSFSAIIKLIILLPLVSVWKIPFFSIQEIKNELTLSFPFFALSITGLFQTKGDLYVVTYFLQEQEIAGYQITIGFLIVGQTFSAIVLGPFLKNIYRWQGTNIDKLKKLYLQIGFVISILFSVGLYFILHYLYLIELTAWYPLLFFAYLFPLYFYSIESQLLLKHRNEKQLLRYAFISVFCNIILSLILVPILGVPGALFSGIVCRLILAELVVRHSKIIMKSYVNSKS